MDYSNEYQLVTDILATTVDYDELKMIVTCLEHDAFWDCLKCYVEKNVQIKQSSW